MIVSFWSCSSSLVLLFFCTPTLHQIVIVVFRWRTNYMRVQIYCCRQGKKKGQQNREGMTENPALYDCSAALPLHERMRNLFSAFADKWMSRNRRSTFFIRVCVYVPEFLPISKFRIPTRNCSLKKNKSLNGVKFGPLPYHTGFSLGFRSIVCTRSIVRSTGPNLWVSPCPPSFFFCAAAPTRPGLLLLLLVGAGAD